MPEAEGLLSTLPEVRLLGLLRGSSNYTFLAALGATGGAAELLAVYKPAAGESPLWDFPRGTLHRREVAAYRLARALGWPRIPPTVTREQAPHGVGSIQLFVEADPARHYLDSAGTSEATWEEVAVFDIVANNADRKSGHCLFGSEGDVWVIDHGLTFHVEPKLRTVIWEFAGAPLPERLRAGLAAAAADLAAGGSLGAELKGMLSPRELRALGNRLAAVLEPGWRFPKPESGWSLPWPPI